MLYIALVVFAGCVVALQPPINAALGRTVGLLESGLVSFAVGTLFLAVAVLLTGRGSVLRVTEIPAWQLAGGSISGRSCSRISARFRLCGRLTTSPMAPLAVCSTI